MCRLFERYPDAKALFSRVNVDHPDSPEWKAHLVRITNGLDIIVNMMDDPSVLFKEIEHLAHQHEAYAKNGMKAVYMTVTIALLIMHIKFRAYTRRRRFVLRISGGRQSMAQRAEARGVLAEPPPTTCGAL